MITRPLKVPAAGRGHEVTLRDLTRTEIEQVRAEFDRYEPSGLAAFIGVTYDELAQLRPLSPFRGRLRTALALLAAVHGYDQRRQVSLGDTPGALQATTRQEVLARLGYGDPSAPKNLKRLQAAADYCGIVLPPKPRPKRAMAKPPAGPAVALRDFVIAWNDPSVDGPEALTRLLGQEDTPRVRASNMRRARTLGMPPLGWASAGLPPQPPTPPVREAVAEATPLEPNAPTEAEGPAGAPRTCATCQAALPERTEGGRAAWSRYCDDRCRARFHERSKTQGRVAANAAVQGPCEHCGAHLEARPKLRRFCSKSCSKKAAYERARTS